MVAASSESDAAPGGEVPETGRGPGIPGSEDVHGLVDLWVVAGEVGSDSPGLLQRIQYPTSVSV